MLPSRSPTTRSSCASAVVADASLLDQLRDADDFARECGLDGYRARWRAFDGDDAGGLRRWKRRELLRTAVRDLLGSADMPSVGRELASLAQACLEAALVMVDPTVAM